MRRGKFITFEGGEGVGKSTQVGRLAAYLESRGIAVLTTREPGGSEGAEAIRELLVTGDPDRWDALTEALLNFAARRDHVEKVIKPALGKGTWVLCDRFADSTTAYQGIAGGLGVEVINNLYSKILGDFSPDFTLVLDLPFEMGLERSFHANASAGSGEDRFEKKGVIFHETLRTAFQEITRENPDRCLLIDAAGHEENIAKNIWKVVRERFGL